MRVSRTLIVAVLGALAACEDTLPPQGQVVLHLDTDAPVAPTDDPSKPVALFDRVLVEIFPPGKSTPCAECVRELAIDAALMRGGRFSFGFVPRPREQGWRARLRMFHSAGRATPRRESTIELVGYLPAVAEDGVTTLTATFHAEDVGRPRGTLEQPIVFDRGAPSATAEGTWPGARVETCTGDPPPGAVCVPGGAFFMGDPRVTVDHEGIGGAKEHLVVLSPFFLDATEVTVGAIRASGLATRDSRGRIVDPLDDWKDDLGGKCIYQDLSTALDENAVMCISWQLASRYCERKGGALPTEAQLEYVASARGTQLAPWGNRDPSCREAGIARGGPPDFEVCNARDLVTVGRRTLPSKPGTGARDRVALPGGEILDLGANVAEWARDSFARDDEGCWNDALLHDPVCIDPARPERSVKGSDLSRAPVDYAQARRAFRADTVLMQYETVGFRCAYPGKR